MVPEMSLLVLLVTLVDRIPLAPRPKRRGRPVVYPDRLFLKALVIMIVRQLPKVHRLLAVLEESTREMQRLGALLIEAGRYPTRRTFERRLNRELTVILQAARVTAVNLKRCTYVRPGPRSPGRRARCAL
jgi:hypothetical protein